MNALLIFFSGALAFAWLPLALRFSRGWQTRKNPVSLAICIATLQFTYVNILFSLALQGETSWRFFSVASHVFEAIVVINFYIAFRWSDKKFVDARSQHAVQGNYTIPPTNASSTPRSS